MDNNTAIIRYQNWIEIFREWAASGMTKRDFCREKNIREKTFYYYQHQIRGMAAESAGLPATERHPHSLKVPYIPEGMDATIAGNTLDLRFTNTFDYAIVIGAVADNGTLTVSISRY